MPKPVEQRRSPRIATRFWVAIDGVDDFLRQRRGDLSLSGIYYETNKPVGKTGSVQWLYLAADETHPPIELMARLVRTVNLDDPQHGGVVSGVAMQFMPESQETREALHRLIEEVEKRQSEPDPPASRRRPNDPRRPGAAPSAPERIRQVLLETSLALTAGDQVRLELKVPRLGRSLSFSCRAKAITPIPKAEGAAAFLAELEPYVSPTGSWAGPRTDAGLDEGEPDDAVHLLFSDLATAIVDGGSFSPGEHLTGELSRLRLPSLLAFLELERMSGELKLTSADRTAWIYVLKGRIVDLVADPPYPSLMAALQDLIEWTQGCFVFAFGEPNRTDQVGRTITALLIDLARTSDESH